MSIENLRNLSEVDDKENTTLKLNNEQVGEEKESKEEVYVDLKDYIKENKEIILHLKDIDDVEIKTIPKGSYFFEGKGFYANNNITELFYIDSYGNIAKVNIYERGILKKVQTISDDIKKIHHHNIKDNTYKNIIINRLEEIGFISNMINDKLYNNILALIEEGDKTYKEKKIEKEEIIKKEKFDL